MNASQEEECQSRYRRFEQFVVVGDGADGVGAVIRDKAIQGRKRGLRSKNYNNEKKKKWNRKTERLRTTSSLTILTS